MKPYRIEFTFAGHDHTLRFQANEKDPTGLVVKSGHPETLDNLIALTGVDPGITGSMKGSHNFIAFMPKDGAAKLLTAAVVALVTKAEKNALAPTGDGDSSDEDEAYEDD